MGDFGVHDAQLGKWVALPQLVRRLGQALDAVQPEKLGHEQVAHEGEGFFIAYRLSL